MNWKIKIFYDKCLIKIQYFLKKLGVEKLNFKYKFGLRAVKTAVSVLICALISTILGFDDVFCSSVASIVCLKQTHEKSMSKGIDRLLGTIFGGIVGYLYLEIFDFFHTQNWIRLYAVPFAILLVIYVCNIFGKPRSVEVASVVLLILVSRYGMAKNSNIIFVLIRTLQTAIGVVVALLVNRFFLRSAEYK